MSNPDKLIRLGDALAAAPHCCACDWADAIAALPAAQVAVKPLVWDVDDDGGFFAASVFGHWRVFSPRIGLWMWALYNRWPNPSVILQEGGQLIANAYHSPEAAKAAAQADYAARIRAALDVGPAHLSARFDADEWHGVLMWTDDGEKTLFDWCAGGGDPDGEFSRIGLRRETADGRVLYRTYTANGQWGEPAPMVEVGPAPDVARLVEALQTIADGRVPASRQFEQWHDKYLACRSFARAALAAWEARNE